MKSQSRTCDAKTRSGEPCQNTELLCGGRCRLHGGLSTGPKTLEGKQRSALNVPGMTYDKFLEDKEMRMEIARLVREENYRQLPGKRLIKKRDYSDIRAIFTPIKSRSLDTG